MTAAAVVFDAVGYEAATTHLIAAEAGTAVGSVYQFFEDKAAIFKAMELRHVERVKAMWQQINISELVKLPLQEMIHVLVVKVNQLFEQPVSKVVFVQFFTARQIFQTIDDSMTQEAIQFTASIFQERNPKLDVAHCALLAEVCVHSSNALILSVLRQPQAQQRQLLIEEIERLLVAYLAPHLGDWNWGNVMKVMNCPHCQSTQISKNGYRRGKQCYLCKGCGKQFVQRSLPQSSLR